MDVSVDRSSQPVTWCWSTAGYCLDPEFHAHDHIGCPEALTDLFTMCDKIHGAGSARSAKAQIRTIRLGLTGNFITRQRQELCSQGTKRGQMPRRWVWRALPPRAGVGWVYWFFHRSASSCETLNGTDLPMGTFTWKREKGLLLLRLRSWCTFIPTERMW